ncbi:MAG: DUF962 domain-containing protein [Proteobacteria bacterium]|nr:DUF962 domain-containing protein [Pseudomonadota bacterium]
MEGRGKLDFRRFWPLYLAVHRHPLTRLAHYIATGTGICSVVIAVITAVPLYAMTGIPLGYAIALASHRWIEGRPSLVGVNAMLGARADLYMCWLGFTGRLIAEYHHLGLVPPQALFARRRQATIRSRDF